MTTATAPNATLVPFTITLKEKAEAVGRDGPDYKLVISGDAFNAPNPQTIWGCSLEEGQRMTVGQSYAVLLERGALTNKKDGTPHDGSRPWMYRWRWGGFNPTPNQAPPPPAKPMVNTGVGGQLNTAPGAPVVPAPTVPTPPRQTPSGYDEHERATDARTAIMQAVEYEKAKIPQEEVHIERVINAAERIYAWLRAQHQAATGARPDVYPDDGSRDQSREPAAAAAPGSPAAVWAATTAIFGPRQEADFKRYGDLLNHAATDFGWNKKRVLKELAIERIEDLVETPASLFASYLDLKAKAGK